MTLPSPSVITLDIFGTVVDWRRGLIASVSSRMGRGGSPIDFDQVIDAQARLESGPYRSYASIVAASVLHLVGGDTEKASAIGREAGLWPLYEDAREGLTRLKRVAPLVAMTNSDRSHGADVVAALGFALDGWVCAEEIRRYKPNPGCWEAVAARLGLEPGARWWHVSAYADYDLEVARTLGLTTVYVRRPHARHGRHDLAVEDLVELATVLESRQG